ncbi:MAG TPA: VWA domain-containing protein [Pyrinomonadaceae bacterium]|jgi:VWFA-related protein
MRKTLFVLLCVSVFGFNALAQTTNPSRPRVSTSPTPSADSQTQNPTTTGKKRPVLIGDTQQRTNPTPNATPQINSTPTNPDEVIEDDEVIRVETNLVTLPVSVLDRDGRFVSGLRQQDFQIFEDGVPQKIENFASVEQPFTVVLLIDVSPSTQYKITEIQDAAIAFVNQLRQNDRVVVISFDERVHVLSPVTNNRALLRNAILQADFGNGTSLYEAVDNALSRQLRQIEGRKAIVMFTDGVDTTSRRASFESTIREAEESEALIYPIRYDTYSDMGGGGVWGGGGGGGYPNQYPRRRRGGGRRLGDILGDILSGGGGGVYGGGGYPQGGGSAGGSREDYARGAQYLQQLAQNSGGRVFQANSTANLDAAFSGIAEELRRQYTIGYYPENAGQVGQRKQVKVRVSRPNAVVRAKNSYIVGGTAAQNNLPPTRKQQPPRILNRLPY